MTWILKHKDPTSGKTLETYSYPRMTLQIENQHGDVRAHIYAQDITHAQNPTDRLHVMLYNNPQPGTSNGRAGQSHHYTTRGYGPELTGVYGDHPRYKLPWPYVSARFLGRWQDWDCWACDHPDATHSVMVQTENQKLWWNAALAPPEALAAISHAAHLLEETETE